jgi:hypothetical protein
LAKQITHSPLKEARDVNPALNPGSGATTFWDLLR